MLLNLIDNIDLKIMCFPVFSFHTTQPPPSIIFDLTYK